MYRFTTPQDGVCGQMPVWPGDDTAQAHHAENINILRVDPSGFDGGVEENNPIWILVQGVFNDYQELNPDSEVFTHGGVKMPHPEYYSGEPDLERFEVCRNPTMVSHEPSIRLRQESTTVQLRYLGSQLSGNAQEWYALL